MANICTTNYNLMLLISYLRINKYCNSQTRMLLELDILYLNYGMTPCCICMNLAEPVRNQDIIWKKLKNVVCTEDA